MFSIAFICLLSKTFLYLALCVCFSVFVYAKNIFVSEVHHLEVLRICQLKFEFYPHLYLYFCKTLLIFFRKFLSCWITFILINTFCLFLPHCRAIYLLIYLHISILTTTLTTYLHKATRSALRQCARVRCRHA